MYAHRIEPGDEVKLSKLSHDRNDGLSKAEAEKEIEKLGHELGDLQELMYAAGTHGLLIVLQGLDTSGKDGSIRHFMRYVNGQSCRVSSFKVPTEKEASHDFLWRIHGEAPGKGWMGIFNRSHYEDVLVARVHDLVPKRVWKDRYDHINAFEALLAESDILVLKFFLHIGKEEQRQRLLEREQDDEKSFKLSVGDWKEREHWDEYQEAYEDALTRCSKKKAPWFVVPADHKWFRDLAITEAVLHALRPLRKEWLESLKERGEKERAELQAFRASKA